MFDERAAFEEALRRDRYDKTTRRVFADWLMENDCPEESDFHRRWTKEWQEAEDFVKDFCKRVDLNYTYFLGEAKRLLSGKGDEHIDCHIDTSNATMDEDMTLLWKNAGVLLHVAAKEDIGDDPFTCGDVGCFPRGLSWGDDGVGETRPREDYEDE